ncbi:MAG TPA: FTR1 family protein [Gemmatimonadota bacterium]|nr:FTR1 family protein [Gemmatimonadota bacterium]
MLRLSLTVLDLPLLLAGDPLAAWAAFLQSFGIILREGVEALLICTALAAAAIRRGDGRGPRPIAWGAAAAILLSLGTAFLVSRVIELSPADQEAIEGVTMLLAAAVLFYVSYWLLSKLEVARWMKYLQERVEGAGSQWALASVAFLAVYREGVETVLFYQALSGVAEAVPIWGGLLAGSLALVVLGIAVLRFGLRLPIKPLFGITGALLYSLAVVFAGQGVHELQEARWISETPLAGLPRIGAVGLYPTVETLIAQGVFIVLALAAGAVLWSRRGRTVVPGAKAARSEAARSEAGASVAAAAQEI